MQHDSNESGMTGEEPSPATQPGTAEDAAPDPTEPDAMAFGPEQFRQIIDALQGENDKLRADFAAEKEQGLRLRAEMDNMRKRMEREKADIAKYAIAKFAGDVVNVADNFERALKAVPEASTAENPTLQALHEGVSMTEREFINTLERHGVKRIDPSGEIFNPHQHQAVMEQQNADVAAGTVLQVFQPGYIIEDRVLRPAMVVVATGGQKPGKIADNGAPQADNDPGPGEAADADPAGSGPGETPG